MYHDADAHANTPAPATPRPASAALGIALAAAIALAPLAVLSGCSTVKGAGEDLQYASDKTAEAIRGDDDD